jgi:hypothetical protein
MAKANLRSKLVFGPETQVNATLQDLNEALHITHNMSGIPTYKTKFLRKIFLPCLSSKTGPDRSKDGKEENIIAVTTRDLCDYYKKVNGKTINTDNLRKTYLAELIDYGFIDEQDSVIHQRHKIYTAIIDLPSTTTDLEEESLDWSLWSNLKRFDQNLHDIAVSGPKNCDDIAPNWLELAFSTLESGRIQSYQIGLLSVDGKPTMLADFMSDYQKYDNLIRYFSKHDSCNSNNETEENTQNLINSDTEGAQSWSNRTKFDQKVQVFSQRFGELEQQSLDGTVKRDELMTSLLSSRKFYQSDAAMLIEEALKLGVIKEVVPDVFRYIAESEK